MEKTILKVPLPEDIRVNGKVAQLVLRPKKAYKCHGCGLPTEPGEPHYSMSWAGAGLGSIKFPSRVCVGCLPQHLGLERTWLERYAEWAVLLGWCSLNRESLEVAGRMKGLTLCLQKIWQDAMRLKERK